ncbi:MBG domain-containing protein [Algoriphagus aquimarinus]|uniref:MBG domain-containing protein n=1 Tax=Algoriphagus aquimarinus TaxID=237018 RepID=UPI0030D915C9|tara:strand:- start:91532 stop:100507 length:8976 start_codon:yes stop_codon:yes gene_type:complete
MLLSFSRLDAFAQTTLNFNTYTTNQGLASPHVEGELEFDVIKGSAAICVVCMGIDTNEGKDGGPGLDDANFEIEGIKGWKISRADNSSFQFLSIWVQHRGAGTSTAGTIKAFSGGSQVGSTVNIDFNSNSAGLKSFSSNPDFYEVDEVVIEGADLYLILDEVTYGAPFIVGNTDPTEVTGIYLVGSPISTAASVQYKVDFSKIAKNVSADDFVLTITGTAIGTIGTVTGSNATYTVPITGISGEGTIRLDLKSGTNIASATDVTGTSAYTSGQVHSISPCLVEGFEDETAGSTTFSHGGYSFSITSAANMEVHTQTPKIGIYGSSYVLTNTDAGTYIISSTTSDINLKKFAVFLSSHADGSVPTSDGSITVVGKRDGNTVYTVSKATGFPTDFLANSGYYIFDLRTEGGTDNSAKAVDQIEISLGGAFQYINIDNFEFCADDVAPSGYSVSIDQDPITPDNDDAVSFTFAGAEIGTTYDYTFSSAGGGTNVTGTGTIVTATDQITGIDLSGLGLGTITLSVTLTDASSNEGDASEDTALKRVFTAPVATAPTAPVVTEDATNVALDNDIQVVDVDGDDQTVTFTITGGTVTLGTTGITFGGSGNGSASFTAAGTLAAINTALDAATFSPTSNLFGTNAGTIAFVSNDGTADSNNASVTFNIAGVNDAPVVDHNGVSRADWTEGASPTVINSAILVSDPEDDNITAATISIVDFVTGDILGITTPSPYTSSYNSGTGVLSLSGTGTAAQMQAALRTVVFSHSTDDPGQGDTDNSRAISFYVTDANASTSSTIGNIGIGISSVNDNPTISGLPTDISVVENTASNVDLSAATFGDPDANSNDITLKLGVTTGTLTASDAGGVTVAGSGTVTLILTGTASEIDAYLNTASNIKYTGPVSVTGNDAATLTLTANDGGNTGTGGGTNVSLGTVNIDIQNAQPSVTLSLSPTSKAENVLTDNVVTATLSSVFTSEVTVNLVFTGTATNTTDYTRSGSTIVIPIGELTGTIEINNVDDAIYEGDETVIVDISSVTNGLENGTQQVTYTITDNDPLPSLSIDNVSVNEDAGVATFTVTLSAASERAASVDYVSSNGTASAGSDYTAVSGTLNFAAGDLTKTIVVSITDDIIFEDSENFSITLTNPTNAVLGTATGTGIIVNDDPTPKITGMSVQHATEGDNLVCTVTLDQVLGTTFTLTHSIGGGTASPADYGTPIYNNGVTVVGTNLLIPAGISSFSITLPTVNDTHSEATETVPFKFGALTIAGNIYDNDVEPGLYINTIAFNENSGTATFTVSLSAASGQLISVNYATSDGTAKAGSDYTAVNGTLNFAIGDLTKTIEVPITDDSIFEGPENFTITLTGATKASILTATGTGTIVDNDGGPTVSSISSPDAIEGEDLVYNIALSNASTTSTSFAFVLGGGSASASDYGTPAFSNGVTLVAGNLILPALVTSFSVTLPTVDDNDFEPTETVPLKIGGLTGTGNILNDDAATLSITANASQSKVFGTTDPVLTYTASGFVDGDDETIITGALSRVAGEGVGTYAISKGDLSAGIKYDINFNPADFEITRATITGITFDDDSFVFDGTAKSLAITGTLPTGTSVAYTNNGRTDVGSQEVTATITGANFNTLVLKADLMITPATTTGITFNDDSFVYDGTVKSLVITGTLPTGTSVAYTNNGRTNVGTQEVTATITGANFNTLVLKADLTITPAGLDIIVSPSQSKVYGTTDPVFTYSATGFEGADSETILTGALARIAGEGVGSYAINQGTLAANANYTIDFVGANFTIGNKLLTITADAQSKVYGQADPALTYTASGFENGDTEAIISGALTRAAGQNVGNYAIQVGDIAAPNYTINFVSDKLDITPKTLSVTADAGQTKTYGDVDPTLSFTATGFEFTDTDALITGLTDRVTGEDVGMYAIQIGGLSAGINYTIDFISDDFFISKRTLQVKANANQAKVYGSADPLFAYTATNLANGDTDAIFTGSLDRMPGEDVGNYAIQLGTLSAGGNYLIAFTSADFAIANKVLNVTASSQTKVYGQTDPNLTYTASGFENGDTEAIISGALARAAGQNVGNYAINVGSLDAGANYSISFTGANFAITPATLNIITDAGQSKIYGAANPAYSYTTIGFQNGDTNSILAGSLARAAGENVGNYAINLGSLDAGANYSINFTGADFSITPRTLTIVANSNQAKVYGSDDPVLAFTASNFGNGDNVLTLTGALSRAAGENIGMYAITLGSLNAGGNYTINFTSADFEIASKVLNVIADAGQSKVFGTADPVFTYQVSGFENGDTNAILSGQLSRAAGENVGKYAISLGSLQAGVNYAINFVGADFAITKAMITGITFADASFVYDETAKSLAIAGTLPVGTSVNFANNSRTSVGTQEVTASITGSNYTTLVLTADLTITKAMITGITFSDESFVYDGSAKSLAISGTLPVGTSVAYSNNSRTDVGMQEVSATVSGSNYTTLVLNANLMVTQATITGISFEDESFVYDGTAKSLAITGTLPVGAEVAYSNNSRTEEGIQEVIATITGSNFTSSELSANLEITKASLVITADAGQNKLYGTADPILTYTASGFGAGDDVSILSGLLARAAGEAVGTYAISIGTLDAGNNYMFDFTGADFEIITNDSDGDGVPDDVEEVEGTDPKDPTDFKDSDGDGVPDFVEMQEGSDPTDAGDYLDTDGDNVPDYVEVQQGTDPNDSEDFLDEDGDGVSDYVQSKSIMEFVVQSLNVAWGTAITDLNVPTQVVVITTEGAFINLPVTWDLTGYDPMNSAIMSYIGMVEIPGGLFNPADLQPMLDITILAKPAPQDVTLSNSEFIGIPDQFFQEIGAFTVIDPTDNVHILSLPEGEGDNAFFEVNSGILFWSSADQQAGRVDFTIVLSVVDRAGNEIKRAFAIRRLRTPLDQLDVPNTFTPNGDGTNDAWGIPALRYYSGVTIQVFDMGGNRIFYTDNPDEQWDGTFKGKEVPVSSYLYVIQVGETGEIRRGMLNLLRQ